MKKEFEVKCKNCDKIFTVIEEETKFPIKGDKYFCCRSCANTRHHSEETKQKISKSINNFINTHDNECGYIHKRKKYKSYCKYCGKEINYIGITNFKLYCSLECKHNYACEHFGGYRENSIKRFKSGNYKGIHCDSSWELAFLVYYLEHNLYIERCKEIRKYIYKDKEHKYIPDFVTDEGIIEIKGYKVNGYKEKQKYNPDIKVLYKDDLITILNYVRNKYGNKFWEVLYDKMAP